MHQSNLLPIRISDIFRICLFLLSFWLWMFYLVKQVGLGVGGCWGRRRWTVRVKSLPDKWGCGWQRTGYHWTGGRLWRWCQGYLLVLDAYWSLKWLIWIPAFSHWNRLIGCVGRNRIKIVFHFHFLIWIVHITLQCLRNILNSIDSNTWYLLITVV